MSEQRQEVFDSFYHGSRGAGRGGYSGGIVPMHTDICRFIDGKHVYFSQQHFDQHRCPPKAEGGAVSWAEEVDLYGEDTEA